MATRTSIPHGRPNTTPSSYPSLDNARFLPGSMVADRYRIIGLLGRGGMGEVYRADDLKLGQPVALKFLPQEVEGNPDRLRRFLNEVRMALRITHANVCRVHDIGEVDGQHFISMEYVDGEDLASLLRRIGRLPEDRGVAIARQICAGLAAAHEQGILHRDLKPANIMIDGRGRARITDFGLADLAGAVAPGEIRAGTPTYMAPEQLAGKEVSERSDIYALGLVLYEIFTGKPAFKAGSAAEMNRLQQSSTPSGMASHVQGLDPAVETAILRALDPDPARRPASALALAAALPGGDPLAAALAAGETPSPEMVADAGEAGGLAPGWVALSLILILAGMALNIWLVPHSSGLVRLDRPLSLVALNERARLMVERLGHDGQPADAAFGVKRHEEYAEWLQDVRPGEMKERIAAGRPAPIIFWYRQASQVLAPRQFFQNQTTNLDDPALTEPGMITLWLDPQARLVQLQAVPPAESPVDTEPMLAPDWEALFREAGLDLGAFTPVEPRSNPAHFADVRKAWEGTYPEAPDLAVRIEAAAYRGQPVSFRIFGPWSEEAEEDSGRGQRRGYAEFLVVVVVMSLLVSIFFLGRRSMRQGRGDLAGATRIVTALFLASVAARLIMSGHFASAIDWSLRTVVILGMSLFFSMVMFLAYMGLEPYVRRLWPESLISWSRILAGRLKDPLVGRDLLIGAVAGTLTLLLSRAHTLVPGLLGLPEEALGFGLPEGIAGLRPAVANLLGTLTGVVGNPLVFLVTLVLLRRLVRRTWLAVGLFVMVSVGIRVLGSPHPVLDAALS
ncbi:MAG: serine/threonine-protein kinase, partial [Acidobacteria bacterium]|nr:serine/threonine-protein kinase [Acidobacteriota bacterium]